MKQRDLLSRRGVHTRICSGQLTTIKRSDSDLPRLRAASVVGPSDREANLPEISEEFVFPLAFNSPGFHRLSSVGILQQSADGV